MRLAGDKPRMIRQLDHFDQQVIHRFCRNNQTGFFKLIAIAIIEFVTMAMAFGDDIFSVHRACFGAGFQTTFLQAKAHGAAEIGIFTAFFDIAAGSAPFGDQADHRVNAILVVFSRIGMRQTGKMARNIDHCRLHAITNTEIRNIVFAGIFRCEDFSFKAAIAETTRHENGIDIAQAFAVIGFDLFGFKPFQTDPRALTQTAVFEGFRQ